MPGIEQGSCILYIYTVSKKPFPITMLSGDEFLSAWWQVVLCHYTLWKHGIYHRDVSPNNLMVYRLNGKWVAVLNDHDLSSISRDRPSDNERAGTVPFIAIELLRPNFLAGQVKHLYHHDAESFVWVLVWVCLRYKDGELLRVREGRLLDDWLKVDATRCREKKSYFQWNFREEDDLDPEIQPSSSHKSTNWKLAVKCLHALYYSSLASMPDDKTEFEKRLLTNMKSVAPHIFHHPVDVL
ncbi:hypothetical protein DEU56DRAFT_747923 [Suillus clintonianus]|uniref:uncharacterized protein n=1 Tax=Suillus clintonianus TaxID=1904413 RepID=UPI001B85DD26|nr:uncharacterized protein DEU56DRAFT_747923 [Suillus clintonianus]KAG2117742.1 hypothetical protein DEU56DRAFT_747923 [Suillus clintonianus]